MFSWDLLANAVVAGLMLGGFYAAVSLGIGIIFGLLDVANIAQPAFLVLGAYITYVMNEAFGIDPILNGILFTPLFFLVGAVVYRVYYGAFERRGEEALRVEEALRAGAGRRGGVRRFAVTARCSASVRASYRAACSAARASRC